MVKTYCEFVVVRHGQTEANSAGILQGQTNTPLDAMGVRQAEAVGRRLSREHFDLAYSSDLGRAMNTALAIAKFHNDLTVTPAEELREWDLGELEGLAYKTLLERYPEIMDSFKHESVDTVIPGGETQNEFQRRIDSFFDSLAESNPGRRLLIVTHGGALQRIFHHAVGPTDDGNYLSLSANTSVNIFRNISGRWQLVTWNDCSHLMDVGQKDTIAY